MAKLKVTQVRSQIGSTKRQKRNLKALGVRRIHNPIEVDDNPQIRGMIKQVSHLVKVEELS